MPLFRNIEPDLRAIIAYIVARARERDITLNRTRLVKLLYLLDVERIRRRSAPLTGLNWIFFHYGPYAFELIDTLESMEQSQLVATPWRDGILYRAAPAAPDGEDWVSSTRRSVDGVLERYVALGLNELLDYVYFHTGPMIDAKRGEPLDMARARNDTSRASRPLDPPNPSVDLKAHLERWRAETPQRLPRVTLDPPASFLEDPADDLTLHESVHARLNVPDGTEL
jgi:hypothetical protein